MLNQVDKYTISHMEDLFEGIWEAIEVDLTICPDWACDWCWLYGVTTEAIADEENLCEECNKEKLRVEYEDNE